MDARLYHKESSAQYRLSLTAYDGVVRLHVNEDAARQRFEVPGVLAPDLATRQVAWDKTSRGATSLQLQMGDVEVQLQYSPVEVTIAVAGQAALSFNSRRMFNFEHQRQKQVLVLCMLAVRTGCSCSTCAKTKCAHPGGGSRGLVGGDLQRPCGLKAPGS